MQMQLAEEMLLLIKQFMFVVLDVVYLINLKVSTLQNGGPSWINFFLVQVCLATGFGFAPGSILRKFFSFFSNQNFCE